MQFQLNKDGRYVRWLSEEGSYVPIGNIHREFRSAGGHVIAHGLGHYSIFWGTWVWIVSQADGDVRLIAHHGAMPATSSSWLRGWDAREAMLALLYACVSPNTSHFEFVGRFARTTRRSRNRKVARS